MSMGSRAATVLLVYPVVLVHKEIEDERFVRTMSRVSPTAFSWHINVRVDKKYWQFFLPDNGKIQ